MFGCVLPCTGSGMVMTLRFQAAFVGVILPVNSLALSRAEHPRPSTLTAQLK